MFYFTKVSSRFRRPPPEDTGRLLPPQARETANGYGAERGAPGGAPPPGASGDSYSSSYTSYYDRFYNKPGGGSAPPAGGVGRPGPPGGPPGEPQSLLRGQFGGEAGGYGAGAPKKPDTQSALQTGPIFF